MKALSIWQPWASAVAHGQKGIETRSWPAPADVIGERFAIHAGLNAAHLPTTYAPQLFPRGAIVGTVVLERCVPMTQLFIEGLEAADPCEFHWGWYGLGRFAFLLRDPILLMEPVPVRGYQRFFYVDDAVVGGTIEE